MNNLVLVLLISVLGAALADKLTILRRTGKGKEGDLLGTATP